jgi:surfeit locus 1 family protein
MNYQFKPKLIPTLAFLFFLPVLLRLGFWQLDRAEQKREILFALEQSRNQPGMSLPQVLTEIERHHYYGITLPSGQFEPNADILLMHQMHGHQHGFHVLTPFTLAADQPKILVNRGFIAKDSKLNIPPPPIQSMPIHGIIDLPKPDRFILGDNIVAPGQKPLEIQRVDVAELSALTGEEYYPIVVLANSELNDGLVRDWQIITTMPPEKHLGYALQWFGLALCLVVIYLVVNIKKGK